MASRFIVMLGSSLLLGACAEADGDGGPFGRVSVEVSPLALTGITGATYTVTVANTAGPVWSRTVTSGQYGDGQGALSYVGPCDATAELADHTIALELVELRDGGGPLIDGVDFTNPAPVGDPLVATARCLPNADAPVVFDLVIARSASQGFFDVAVEFDDIFCSAKLDCERSPGVPLELLTDALGVRALTAVVGFTCTAGDDADTWLWMDRLVVTCEGGGPFIVDVADGPGHLDPVFDDPTSDLLFQAAIYRGIGNEGGAETAYWNAALGLNAAAFATLGDCTLTGMATATDGPLDDGVTPAGVRYPIVMWNVPLIEDGVRVCTTHALDTGDGVTTGYSPLTGHGFHAGFEQSTGLVTVTGAAPDNTSTLLCGATELEVGQSTSCILVANQAGQPIGTASGNFQVSATVGTFSALSPAFGTSFTFTYTATASGVVVIDSGVGPTATLTVIDQADGAQLSCASDELAVGGTTTCTLVPLKAGSPITARASDIAVSTSAGTTSALSPSIGTSFTFTYTAPATTGAATVSALGQTVPLTIYDTPDSASLSCAATTLAVNGTTTCTLLPFKAGSPITARASDIALTTSAGTTSALSPSIGTSFTFTYTAPATSQLTTLSSPTSLFGSLGFTITATPDATSITTSATSTCTITPRRAGAVIYTASTSFSPSTSAGSVSAVTPTGIATSFTFTLTAPSTAQTLTVGSGLTTTNVTVTATCSDGVKNGTETAIDCGGSCGDCANGQTCSTASDCVSSFCSSGTCAWATSCNALLPQNPTSGEYTIDPDGAGASGTYLVYCDMVTAGGGWTVFRNVDVGSATSVNQAWRTDKTRVVAYLRDNAGNRFTTVLQQLTNYAASDLQLTNVGNGYQVQFAPNITMNSINGFRSNGTDYSFVNCDSNANSYFQFYRSGSAGSGGTDYPLAQSWIGSRLTFTPAMGAAFFGNFTLAFGGCGAFTHNANLPVAYTAALGLR
ncbi:MAG TPA: fibrinogen-like YCDxxxxGGGW domain-containing protein [Myxococcota bacterium]|nr:fibrinogen-like YCDxxxxGGGW domain-containing protein [Myxococcota bacterium]